MSSAIKVDATLLYFCSKADFSYLLVQPTRKYFLKDIARVRTQKISRTLQQHLRFLFDNSLDQILTGADTSKFFGVPRGILDLTKMDSVLVKRYVWSI